MKKLLLNLYFWPLFVLITMTAIMVSPLMLLGNRLLSSMDTGRFVRMAILIYGKALLALASPFVRVQVMDQRGDADPPLVYAANHQSAVDPYLFAILEGDNAFITTWPFSIPLYNIFMRLAGYIDAAKGFQHVKEKAAELLSQGCSLIVWPEGHRSRDGRLGRFKNGAFVVADLAQTGVVPVCIDGSGKVMPPGSRLLSPGRITVSLMPPVFPQGPKGEPETVRELKHRVRSMIAGRLERGGGAGPDTAGAETR